MSTNAMQNSENKLYKQWTFATVAAIAAAFLLTASVTIYKDPFFHYHAPLKGYHYPQAIYPDNNERYVNDGILKHFSYDGIITGTSMAENFKATEADALFDARFVKVAFAGAKYKEIDDSLRRAYQAGKHIKYVIRSLDYTDLILDKDTYDQTFDYPTYLYNNNPFDDVRYVLNKSVLLEESMAVEKAKDGADSAVNFDTYGSWFAYHQTEFGADHVLSTYQLKKTPLPSAPLTAAEKQMLAQNLRQNITALAAEHPETTFYLFFPPYSIAYWDLLNNTGGMLRQLEAERLAIETLLPYSNIKLFSFSDDSSLICNLDNYKDYLHYGEWINSRILQWLREEKGLLTQDNYKAYSERMHDFYLSYDYASLHNK